MWDRVYSPKEWEIEYILMELLGRRVSRRIKQRRMREIRDEICGRTPSAKVYLWTHGENCLYY